MSLCGFANKRTRTGTLGGGDSAAVLDNQRIDVLARNDQTQRAWNDLDDVAITDRFVSLEPF